MTPTMLVDTRTQRTTRTRRRSPCSSRTSNGTPRIDRRDVIKMKQNKTQSGYSEPKTTPAMLRTQTGWETAYDSGSSDPTESTTKSRNPTYCCVPRHDRAAGHSRNTNRQCHMEIAPALPDTCRICCLVDAPSTCTQHRTKTYANQTVAETDLCQRAAREGRCVLVDDYAEPKQTPMLMPSTSMSTSTMALVYVHVKDSGICDRETRLNDLVRVQTLNVNEEGHTCLPPRRDQLIPLET